MATTPPTAADLAEAARHRMVWVQVKAPRLTFALGNGNYALSANDWCTVPAFMVKGLRLDDMIF